MKVPQWKLLEVARVKGTPYNPPNRIEESRLKDLAKEMLEIGLIYPIVVSEQNVVIDGNRRLAAAKSLGWETIAAIVMKGDSDKIYAAVNSTSKRLGGNDALAVWLQAPNAISGKPSLLFAEMKDVLGLTVMNQICEAGHSGRLYKTAKQLARYCYNDDPGTFKLITIWLLKHEMSSRLVEHAMARGESSRTLMNAVKNDKPIKMQLMVDD
jgi:ParB-like chromosome segregation protein Spo0J